MKKVFTTILLAMMALASWAYDCEVGGIYYNLVSKAKEAEVTYGDNKYSGAVTIPETFEYDDVTYSVTSIGKDAFKYCSGLTSVTIPNSVTSIGDYAFSSSGLTSVTIGNSVTSIGSDAFYFCINLTSVTIPNSVTSIGEWAFWNCALLTSVTIPNSVTSIGEGAFYFCISLTSVTIPNSVTSIGSGAFEYCSGLFSVTIGSSVSQIDYGAFSHCKNLVTVTCYAEEVPSMGYDSDSEEGVFTDSNVNYATLKVPAKSVELYKAADQWKEFGTIMAIDDTGINAVEGVKDNSKHSVYNLSGVKADGDAKGILIIDGKKVLKR